MGAEIKTNLCVFFETILYIVSFPSSTFHSAIYWTPWWAIQWEVRDLLGHLKVRVGHIVSNKWWENITLWASEFTIFLKCARSLITKIIVECVSSLAMDIHKKKTFYAGDKTFIEGKAASFLYCSISHGLTSDIYEKIASIWYPPLFCGLIKFASASAYKPILTFIHTTRNNMS